ncbi:hypothetical protein CRENBAI_015058 [Crenichthys baileyi]|uniref:Uncharacterized protein n=1 Tax=Crenichthys baileyi TaxID=28760 RepID=A0AAV9QZD9_9TELE
MALRGHRHHLDLGGSGSLSWGSAAFPLGTVVGRVMRRRGFFTAWLALVVLVCLSMGDACAYAGLGLAFGWACPFGLGVAHWRPRCLCGMCWVSAKAVKVTKWAGLRGFPAMGVAENVMPFTLSPNGCKRKLSKNNGGGVSMWGGLEWELELTKDKYIKAHDVAWYGGAGVPPWSQAWGRDSPESVWWPGCSSWDLARPSPNKRREAIPRWAHHLQREGA